MNRVSTILAGLLMSTLLAGSQPAVAGRADRMESATTLSGEESSLPAPGGLRAKPRVRGVLLKWKPVAESTGYRIYWGKQGHAIPFSAQVAEVASDRLQYRVNYLLPGVSYGFRVSALRSCEEGRLSHQVTAAPQGNVPMASAGAVAFEKAAEGDWMSVPETDESAKMRAPRPPMGLKAKPRAGGVLLQWKPVAGSTGYRIYWEEARRVSRCSNLIGDLPPEQVSCELGDLSPGVPYRFRVSTLRASQEGPLSRQVAAKPKEGLEIKASDCAP